MPQWFLDCCLNTCMRKIIIDGPLIMIRAVHIYNVTYITHTKWTVQVYCYIIQIDLHKLAIKWNSWVLNSQGTINYSGHCLSIKMYIVLYQEKQQIYLKTLDTIGNCQRQVFSLGVSQHTCKKNKTVNIWAQLVVEVARY